MHGFGDLTFDGEVCTGVGAHGGQRTTSGISQESFLRHVLSLA